ncbi:hypothetical protein GW17_00015176, partial [Ensete ventricosum]
GLKRVCKAVDTAGKELHSIIHEHLQPALEIIVFRIAELRGLSRWRARYHIIGLNEELIDCATEKAGMLLVHVERFLRILATVLYQCSGGASLKRAAWRLSKVLGPRLASPERLGKRRAPFAIAV